MQQIGRQKRKYAGKLIGSRDRSTVGRRRHRGHSGIQTERQAAGKQYQANRQQRGQASDRDTDRGTGVRQGYRQRDRRQENSIKLTDSREDRHQAGIQTERQAAGEQY